MSAALTSASPDYTTPRPDCTPIVCATCLSPSSFATPDSPAGKVQKSPLKSVRSVSRLEARWCSRLGALGCEALSLTGSSWCQAGCGSPPSASSCPHPTSSPAWRHVPSSGLPSCLLLCPDLVNRMRHLLPFMAKNLSGRTSPRTH